MGNPAGGADNEILRVDFDRRGKLEFHGSRVTADAGLLAYGELDDVLDNPDIRRMSVKGRGATAMSYVEQRLLGGPFASRLSPVLPFLPIILAAIPVLVPIYIGIAEHPWKTDNEGHGPFILVAALWLFYRRLDAVRLAPKRPAPVIGWAILLFGLFALFVGRTQGTLTLEAGSQLPIACGLILIVAGPATLRVLRFPLFFMIFTFPMPVWLLDAITIPLKSVIADYVVDLLYAWGYPVAQNGVIITVGAYELLVKDACSGINSMFSLSAVSLFYIHLAKHT